MPKYLDLCVLEVGTGMASSSSLAMFNMSKIPVSDFEVSIQRTRAQEAAKVWYKVSRSLPRPDVASVLSPRYITVQDMVTVSS